MRKINIYEEEMEIELGEVNLYEVEYMNSDDNQDYIEEYGLQDWAEELIRE
jgi:hypothetical protein